MMTGLGSTFASLASGSVRCAAPHAALDAGVRGVGARGWRGVRSAACRAGCGRARGGGQGLARGGEQRRMPRWKIGRAHV